MSEEYLTLDDLIHELNKDPEFRKEDRKQAPIYAIVREVFRLRKKRGLTQTELAELAGTHQPNISKIEAGELDVRLSTLVSVAEALGTRLDIQFTEYMDEECEDEVLVPLAEFG